jgi:hypothetical protein
MAASLWAKEWRSLATDNSQKAILLTTFFKAYGIWPADIPKEAVEKLVAGRTPDEILQVAQYSSSPKTKHPNAGRGKWTVRSYVNRSWMRRAATVSVVAAPIEKSARCIVAVEMGTDDLNSSLSELESTASDFDLPTVDDLLKKVEEAEKKPKAPARRGRGRGKKGWRK